MMSTIINTMTKSTLSRDVAEHIKEYRNGVRMCPRTKNNLGREVGLPVGIRYDATYIAEWDRQCLELRKTMFCKGVAK